MRSSTTRWILLCLGLVSSGVLLGRLTTPEEAARDDRIDQGASQVATHRRTAGGDLRDEVAALHAQVRALDDEMSAAAEDRAAVEEPAPPPDLEQIAAEEAATSDAFAARIDQERDDPAWSRAREDELTRDGLQRPGVRDIAVSCREHLCQVDVDLDGLDPQAFLNQITFEPAWNAETWWHVTDYGLEMYLSRDGYGLSSGQPVPRG